MSKKSENLQQKLVQENAVLRAEIAELKRRQEERLLASVTEKERQQLLAMRRYSELLRREVELMKEIKILEEEAQGRRVAQESAQSLGGEVSGEERVLNPFNTVSPIAPKKANLVDSQVSQGSVNFGLNETPVVKSPVSGLKTREDYERELAEFRQSRSLAALSERPTSPARMPNLADLTEFAQGRGEFAGSIAQTGASIVQSHFDRKKYSDEEIKLGIAQLVVYGLTGGYATSEEVEGLTPKVAAEIPEFWLEAEVNYLGSRLKEYFGIVAEKVEPTQASSSPSALQVAMNSSYVRGLRHKDLKLEKVLGENVGNAVEEFYQEHPRRVAAPAARLTPEKLAKDYRQTGMTLPWNPNESREDFSTRNFLQSFDKPKGRESAGGVRPFGDSQVIPSTFNDTLRSESPKASPKRAASRTPARHSDLNVQEPLSGGKGGSGRKGR